MKQTLSVADFAIILDLLNEKIFDVKNSWDFRHCVNECQTKEERLEKLKSDPYYQSLLHLKESLQNLNIDVETPSVEVEDKGEQNGR